MLLKRLYFLLLMLPLSLAFVGCPATGGDDDDSADDDDDATPPPGGLDCDNATDAECGANAGTTVGVPSGNDDWASCVGYGPGYTGGDMIFEYTAGATESVTVDLEWSDGAADMDLFALASCAANGECLAESSSVDPGESVTFDAVSGTTYWLIVDGWGSESDFVMTVNGTCGGDDDDATGDDDDATADDDDSAADDDDDATADDDDATADDDDSAADDDDDATADDDDDSATTDDDDSASR